MKKITLCADDYGQHQSISDAIIALLEKNRLSATSCMTSSPRFAMDAERLQPFIRRADIGLHFNLTEGSSLSGQLAFLPLSRLILKACAYLLKPSAIEAELHAQLDAFEASMGKLPDFVDGHQHIHQLPGIRDALFRVYEKRLRKTNSYLRCLYHPASHVNSFKGRVIQLLGARAFKKRVVKENIPHNSSFSGIYPFSKSKHYARIFPHFLAEVKDGGMIMCHPGLSSHDPSDALLKSRYQEFLYLNSDDFLRDCFRAGVSLQRLSK